MLNLTEIATRIKQPELCTVEDIDSLKTLCETYPYSQLFPLLYLKVLAQTNDVRLDSELQRFAYKIADRAILFDLLNSKDQVREIEVVNEIKSPPLTNELEVTNSSSETSINKTKEEISPDAIIVPIEETVGIHKEISISEEITDTDEEPTINNLIETIDENTEELKSSEETINAESNPTEEVELPTLPDDVLQSFNIGSEVYSLEAEEAKIAKEKAQQIEQEALELEKQKLIEQLTPRKPLLEPIKPVQEEKIDSERSFTGWLKQNTARIEQTEEKIDPESLIEQFIQKGRKISPQKEKLFEDRTDKNELFNPIKKAKESLDDKQLPVSETLAKIFAAQGNFPKAIYAYQQLMLIFPEKKVFFATQIEELNKKINI